MFEKSKMAAKMTDMLWNDWHYHSNLQLFEMKFGRVVENHKPINLVQFNWQMVSSLHHNDVITVKILDFYEILLIKIRKV